MANSSIKEAFTQFWNYVVAKNGETLTAAKEYTNTKVANFSSEDTKNTAGSTNSTSKMYLIGATEQADNPQTYSNSAVYATDGALVASTVTGAVWNDYAEYRESAVLDPGRVVVETGKGDLVLSTARLQPGGNIISDTFGFSIGQTEKCCSPIAVSGRVLAYTYEDRDSYQAGDAVCTGPNGTISKMTREEIREYSERIIGTVSEIPTYDHWGEGNVAINGRIWIKI